MVKRLDGTTISPAEIPGLGIAVLNNGKIIYLKAYGIRDKEKNLPLTVDSAMYAASFTKSAFAYMVMHLVGNESLDLDKPIYQYLHKPLSEYANYKDLANDARYKQITAHAVEPYQWISELAVV